MSSSILKKAGLLSGLVPNFLSNAEAGEGTIKDNMDDLRDILEDEILKSKASNEEKRALLKRLRTFCDTETNIMLVGATGCGKVNTILLPIIANILLYGVRPVFKNPFR